jgi:hypothetical protein
MTHAIQHRNKTKTKPNKHLSKNKGQREKPKRSVRKIVDLNQFIQSFQTKKTRKERNAKIETNTNSESPIHKQTNLM